MTDHDCFPLFFTFKHKQLNFSSNNFIANFTIIERIADEKIKINFFRRLKKSKKTVKQVIKEVVKEVVKIKREVELEVVLGWRESKTKQSR